MTTPKEKIAAAQDAVAKAAALLLEHAEGLAMLAMMERRREPPGPESIAFEDAGRAMIRNWPAEQAWCRAALAAAEFAGHFETFRQERDRYSELAVTLREEVDKLVGEFGRMPPTMSGTPDSVVDPRLGVTLRQVHAQAWKLHLAASVAKVCLVETGEGLAITPRRRAGRSASASAHPDASTPPRRMPRRS